MSLIESALGSYRLYLVTITELMTHALALWLSVGSLLARPPLRCEGPATAAPVDMSRTGDE